MHNSQDFPYDAPTFLDDIGGEPLAGSRFENESGDSESVQSDLFQVERQAPVEE